MTVQRVYERIQSEIPGIPFYRVLDDINTSVAAFAVETRVCTRTDTPTLGVTFAAAADVIRILALRLYDASGNELDGDSDYAYRYLPPPVNSVHLTDACGNDIAGTGDVKSIKMDVAFTPATVAALNDALAIPSQYHQAIVDRLLSIYLAVKAPNVANLYEARYDRAVAKAKRFTNTIGTVEDDGSEVSDL